MKTQISNISAVGIIYRALSPSEIFIEVKDGGHPIPLVRGQLCVIGGNWIGENARNDKSPLDTFRREFDEELTLEPRPSRTDELVTLGIVDKAEEYTTPRNTRTPSEKELAVFRGLKHILMDACQPFGDFLLTISKGALDSADPKNTRTGWTGLCSYFVVPVAEPEWLLLQQFQGDYGNLSNESITLIVTLHEIVKRGTKAAFGHDGVLQRFFQGRGFIVANDMQLVPGTWGEMVGMPLSSYDEYLKRYDIARTPFTTK